MHHEVARQQGECLGREVDLVEIGDLEPQLRRQGFDEVRLRDEPLADEYVPQTSPLDLLASESGLDLVLADQAVCDEQSAESATARRRSPSLRGCSGLPPYRTHLPAAETGSLDCGSVAAAIIVPLPGGRSTSSRLSYRCIGMFVGRRQPLLDRYTWGARGANGAGLETPRAYC